MMPLGPVPMFATILACTNPGPHNQSCADYSSPEPHRGLTECLIWIDETNARLRREHLYVADARCVDRREGRL